jgi:hypothetical protein
MAWRHASLSCECLATMHLVILGTSGIKSEQSRIASGAQAWRCSGVPWAVALAKPTSSRPAGNNSRQTRRALRTIPGFPLMQRQPSQSRRTLEHDPPKRKPVFRKAMGSLEGMRRAEDIVQPKSFTLCARGPAGAFRLRSLRFRAASRL